MHHLLNPKGEIMDNFVLPVPTHICECGSKMGYYFPKLDGIDKAKWVCPSCKKEEIIGK